jgi:hypothetical protein
MMVDQLLHRVRLEWRMSRDELVAHHRQRVLVRSPVHTPPVALFRRHVLRRTDDRTSLRQLRVAHQRLGNPKVGQVDVTLGVEQDVRRLHITVDHAALVRVTQTGRRLEHRLLHLTHRQHTARAHDLAQRAA